MDTQPTVAPQNVSPTESGTPRVITAARILTIIQIVFAVAFIGVLVWLVDYQPAAGFWAGFREAMTEEMPFYSYEDAGTLSAGSIVTIITSVLVLLALSRRTRSWAMTAYVGLGIQIVIGITSLSIPVLAIANLLLLMSAQGKAYLNFAKPASPVAGAGQ